MFDKCVTTNQHNSKLTQNTKTVSAVDKKLEVTPFNHRLQNRKYTSFPKYKYFSLFGPENQLKV